MLPPASGPTLALQLPSTTSPRQGYQVNVLGSSLVARLKQRQTKDADKQTAKPPRPSLSKPALKKSNKMALRLKLDGLDEEGEVEVMHTSDEGHLATSKRQEKSRRPRANSAANGDANTSGNSLPRLTSASRSPAGSRISSRRSLSAGESQTRGGSRRSGACPSASSFVPRAPSHPVHVVKRDGVFQPADKYMPGRTGIRDEGPVTLWDYHTYVLPMMDSNSDSQSPRFSDPDLSPRGVYLGSGKKRMKVSWKTVLHPELDAQMLAQYGDGLPESRQDTNPTPSTTAPASASKQRRAQSVDNLAFRRPVYQSGLSQVSSIGLKWQIPAGSTGQLSGSENNATESLSSPRAADAPAPACTPQQTTTTPQAVSKPMWSYLITHDTRQQQHAAPSLPERAPVSKARGKGSKASTRSHKHSRDVHPVSTAMEKIGTSVSRTKWTVPSSSASGLEAERAVRDRLQLVKRQGSLLLYEPGGRGTSNSAAQRFRQAMVAAGRADDIDDANRGEHGSGSYRTSKGRDARDREDTDGSHLSGAHGRLGKREELTHGTTSGTQTNDDKTFSARDDDQLSSPTKSRSTFYN